MKRILIAIFCLVTLSLSLVSCSARMTAPDWGRIDRIGEEIVDGAENRNADDSTEFGAGDYRADESGRVRTYNSDNDLSR